MNRISAQGIELIKSFEGFSARQYICPAGKPTIGYGHVITADDVLGDVISEAEAQALLLSDLEPMMQVIAREVLAPLSQNQFDALCSLIYNIGIGAFTRSTLLKLLNQNPMPKHVSEQFLRWVYVGTKPSKGLKTRRMQEKDLFDRAG